MSCLKSCFPGVFALIFIAATSVLSAEYELSACDLDKCEGAYNKSCTPRIQGDKKFAEEMEGVCYFNTFGHPTGSYKVEFHIVKEDDGDPEYKVSAGSNVLGKGRYPWNGGCGLNTTQDVLDLGTHTINENDKISVWGRSVYHCQKSTGEWHGAYTRWKKLVFIPDGDTDARVSREVSQTNAFGVKLKSGLLSVVTNDNDHFKGILSDLQGKTVKQFEGRGKAVIAVNSIRAGEMLVLKLQSGSSSITRKLVLD